MFPPVSQVKAGHLAPTEEDTFLRQITDVVAKVKKKDKSQLSGGSPSLTSSTGSETRTQSSSVSVLYDSQGSKSMPSLTSSEVPPISPTPPLPQGLSEEHSRKSSQESGKNIPSGGVEGRDKGLGEGKEGTPVMVEDFSPSLGTDLGNNHVSSQPHPLQELVSFGLRLSPSIEV